MTATSIRCPRLVLGMACMLAAGALAQAAPTSRQQALAHSRRLQGEIRACKKASREARRVGESAPQAPAHRPPAAARPRLGGVFCIALLGMGALTDPAVLQALAQTDPTDRYLTEATNGLAALDPVCGPAALAGRVLPPCDPDYRAGVLAQARDILAQARRLFQDPEVLGAGWCLRGESVSEAKERIALLQSDQLAEFDRVSAQATALMLQLNRDAFQVQAAGAGLHLGQSALLAAGGGEAAATAAFALGQVGESLSAVGYVIGGVADGFGEVGSLTLAKRAAYQRYANAQDALALNCTGAPEAADDASLTSLTSPQSAMDTALRGMSEGCALAARHHLDLPVCGAPVAEAFRSHNATIAHLYSHGIACLTAGILRGRQAPCPTTPLSDARSRSDTFTYFDEFAGLVGAAGDRTLSLGNGLFAGSRSLNLAANAAARAGSTAEAADLFTGAGAVALSAGTVFAQGFDLLRIAALSRVWLTEVIQAFNAESMAHLNEREAEDAVLAGSAPEGESSTAEPVPFVLAVASTPQTASSTAPAEVLVLAGLSSSGPMDGATSGAPRARTPGLLDLLRRLLPCPRRAAEGDL